MCIPSVNLIHLELRMAYIIRMKSSILPSTFWKDIFHRTDKQYLLFSRKEIHEINKYILSRLIIKIIIIIIIVIIIIIITP